MQLTQKSFSIKKYWSSNFHVFELLEWLDDEKTDIFVVDLKTGNVTTMQTDPFYSAHHVNAYQDTKVRLLQRRKCKLSLLHS